MRRATEFSPRRLELVFNLRIPGPMPLPDDVLEAAGAPMINHRGPIFEEIIGRMTLNMQTLLQTRGDVYFFTASGTGAMEGAIVNSISPGDDVLSVSIGFFGDRFADIAEAYGTDVTRFKTELGKAAEPDEVRDALREIPDCKAVLVTHNDTSTAVQNDLGALSEVVRAESDALVLVDAVSSAGGTPLPVDGWGLDLVATASQKAWMAPPGIGILAVSERAWEAYERSTMPKYYFDIAQYRRFLEIGQPPFTPALPTIFGLDHALQQLAREGIESIFARHSARAKQTRDGLRALGLELFADESVASDTVTAAKVPESLDARKLVSMMREEHGVEIAGGQGSLAGVIIRIGHMGYCEEEHIADCMRALEASIKTLA